MRDKYFLLVGEEHTSTAVNIIRFVFSRESLSKVGGIDGGCESSRNGFSARRDGFGEFF